ncbi:MAG: PEGA domain-containing protein [Deltaproteobacteria bacterium]|jgi:hypothetical protein|nr:PEGA domain-containing protein [Deltaproteobacteria bacterium]MBW2537377.1 PEGA domain-containing protein [Deltaproteobacteria bacterium]
MSPRAAIFALLLGSVALTPSAEARPQEPSAEPPQAAAEGAEPKEEAKKLFKRGLASMKSKRFNEALRDFLASRELYATRGNTQNAAVCLRELGRFDESLAMFEALLKEFDNLSDADKSNVQKEVTFLRAKVGSVDILVIEPDAEVMIDGRARGRTPLSAPLRVSVGVHIVRIYKPGFAPLEERIVVAPRKTVIVDGTLDKLVRSGQLKVVAAKGKSADVLVDGAVVGQTPWEGSVAVGKHSVVLQGEGELGTAPVTAKVTEGEVSTLRLELVALESEIRVEPVPVNAMVALDGVELGRGIWEGRVAAGDHRIEVAAEGFIAKTREVTLDEDEREVVQLELERDPDSALWTDKTPGRVIFDLHMAPVVAPLVGGDLADGCTGDCSGGLGIGALAMLRGGYQFGVGIGLTLDAGYLLLHQGYADRAGTLTPRGLAANAGTLEDDVLLMGLLAGASGSYQVGEDWPFQVRVGGGIFLGSLRDERSGAFTTNEDPVAYTIDPLSESQSMTYAFVSPELRIGYRVTESFIVSLSAQGLFLFALSQPEWSDEQPVLAGNCDGSVPTQCEGQALFGSQALAGETIIAISPGLALKLEL